MLAFTVIARQSDALALSADTESGPNPQEHNKLTAKNLLRKLAATGSPPALLTVDSSSNAFHVLTEGGVMFLTMTDISAPSAIAYAYLEDVAREFLQQYGGSIEGASRPYAFIKFDLYLQKTKKVFSSPSSAQGVLSQRANRPQPVRRSFRDVMGYGDANLVKPKGSQANDITLLIFIGVGVAILIIIVVLVMAFS